MEDATPEQLNKIQKQVTEKYERRQPLFEQEEQEPIVKKYVEDLWQRIVASHKTGYSVGRKPIQNGKCRYPATQ